jgi:hypothetical protein
MSDEFPTIVPRNADGIQRVIVIGGGSGRSSFQEPETHEPIEAMRRQYGEMIDRMFPGRKIVTWLPHRPGSGGNCNSLPGLQQLVDAGQCDAIVVQSFCRLSRSHPGLCAFVEGLKPAGVRLISLADQFDSSTDRWSAALAGLALPTKFNLPVDFNASS